MTNGDSKSWKASTEDVVSAVFKGSNITWKRFDQARLTVVELEPWSREEMTAKLWMKRL